MTDTIGLGPPEPANAVPLFVVAELGERGRLGKADHGRIRIHFDGKR